MKIKLMLVTILIVAFYLRFSNIDSNPPALYGDELTMVYDVYSILKTGYDQTGVFLPITFHMGAGRPGGYIYASIPFVALFGPSALGIRALSIFSGLGLTILLYLIAERLFSRRAGILAAILMAISPWDLSLSRGGFESHFALFLAILGLYLFIIAQNKPWLLILSAISFALTFHTYPTYKLVLPLFLILLFWFIARMKNPLSKNMIKFSFISLIIFLLISFLAIIQSFTSGSETRLKGINIFSQKELSEQIERKIVYERSISDLALFLSRYSHNKYIEYTKVFGENYLQNFSIDFLFLHGDKNPRHNMGAIGEFFIIETVFILSGLLNLWVKDRKNFFFLLLWSLIGPLGSAFIGSPHALRSAFMLPPLILISAYGFNLMLDFKKTRGRIILSLSIIVLVFQLVFYIQKLFSQSPNEYSNFWSYPAKLASEVAILNKDSYKYVILSDKIDAIEFAYPVYAKIDPAVVVNKAKNIKQINEFHFFSFDNVLVGYIPDTSIEDFIKSIDGSVLFIGDREDIRHINSYETIEGKDKKTALVIKKKND